MSTKKAEKIRFLDKWKGRLAIQLGILILAMNLIVLILCFAFLYGKIGDILLEKDEKDNIERFRQSEYNIGNFCEQVDLALKRLITDSGLKKLARDSRMPEGDLYYYANKVLGSFEAMQENYPYIRQICFYGDNGVILKDIKGTGAGKYFEIDEEKSDSFYASAILHAVETDKQVWHGGYLDEGLSATPGEGDEAEYGIIAARDVASGLGTLVISASMEYFLDIFYANAAGTSEVIYIMDGDCRIVAAKDAEMLGSRKHLPEGEEIQPGIEKYIEDTERGEVQTIVYSLPAMGWKLLSETPVAEVTKESRHLKKVMALSCCVSVAASFALSMWWVSRLLKPLNELTGVMRKVGSGRLGDTFEKVPGNELGVLIGQFNQMSLDIKELFRQKEYAEEERRELEMRSLRAQINPHLIYNVLNAIKWRALISEERSIAESIALLSDFLEPVFKNQKLKCTVKEELDYVRNYIEIMNLLRAGGYALELAVPEECRGCQIIRFLLQPVVENSILHGLAGAAAGKIRISMGTDGGDALIWVEDNGCGIEEERLEEVRRKLLREVPVEGEGIGIVNVDRRIKNHYGEGYGLSIANGETAGTVVTLRIKTEL